MAMEKQIGGYERKNTAQFDDESLAFLLKNLESSRQAEVETLKSTEKSLAAMMKIGAAVAGSSSSNPQSQSELELRKRVADLEEENRSIKQRLERIEMMFWQQQQQFMSIHQQPNVPGLQQFQPNLIQKDVQQQGLQASGQVSSSLLPPQNVSQLPVPEMPSASLDSRGSANGGDWQEMVFQKIKSMKEMYLGDLTEIHQRVTAKLQLDSLPHQQRSEQSEKLEKFKEMLERVMRFLSVSKSDVMPELKDKVDYYEKQIIHFLSMHMPRKAQEQKRLP